MIYYPTVMKLINNKTGQEIKKGDRIKSFSGGKATFKEITLGPRGNKPGTIRIQTLAGKIFLQDPGVYDAKIER